MKLFAGTSGFSYSEWKGSFYPEDLAGNKMLAFYGRQLPAVEINNTFYRMPRASVLKNWLTQVPDTFLFAVKASRRITHLKRLVDCADETAYLVETLGTLGSQLGALLFQLPPYLRCDLERLKAFLALLPPSAPAVFEFRHPSWLEQPVFDLLASDNRPVVWVDQDDQDTPHLPVTAEWAYLRLRRSGYDSHELADWRRRLDAESFERALVFFKHEDGAAGPLLAQKFLGPPAGDNA